MQNKNANLCYAKNGLSDRASNQKFSKDKFCDNQSFQIDNNKSATKKMYKRAIGLPMLFLAIILMLGLFMGVTYSAFFSNATVKGELTFAVNGQNVQFDLQNADIIEYDNKTSSTYTKFVLMPENQDSYTFSSVVIKKENINGELVQSGLYNYSTDSVTKKGILQLNNVLINFSLYISIDYRTTELIKINLAVNDESMGNIGTAQTDNITQLTGIHKGSAISVSADKQSLTIDGQTIIAKPTNSESHNRFFKDWSYDGSTITANFIQSIKTFTVTFCNDNGSVLQEVTVDYNKPATYTNTPQSTKRKTGYHYDFIGWESTLGSNDTASLSNIKSDKTVYAKYNEVVNQYTINFDGNGATSVTMAPQSITYGTTENLILNTFVLNGYDFVGWSKTKKDKDSIDKTIDYANGADASNMPLNNGGSTTLYAVWKKGMPKYTIKFSKLGFGNGIYFEGIQLSLETIPDIPYGATFSATTNGDYSADFIIYYNKAEFAKCTWRGDPVVATVHGWYYNNNKIATGTIGETIIGDKQNIINIEIRGEGICFTGDTLVWVDNGSQNGIYKRIDSVKQGEKVFSYNQQTGKIESKPILSVKETLNINSNLTLVDLGDEIIKTTYGHKFLLADGKWKSAGDLKTGDLLKTANGEKEVLKISYKTEKASLYNLLVQDESSFIITKSNIVVHGAYFGSSVKGDMLVWYDNGTKNGGYKQIKDIKVGDIVFTYNEETKSEEKNKVLDLHYSNKLVKNIVELNVGGDKITLSAEHMVMLEDGSWQQAGALKQGDKIKTNNGFAIIENIVKNVELQETYNLTIMNNHNYFVGKNNIIVHNIPDKCWR